MQILRDLNNVPAPAKGAALALGNFDGLHIGHQAILDATLEQAKAQDIPAAVMSFEPHPREFFAPESPKLRLMKLTDKIEMLRALGFDYIFLPRFNRELAATSADDFVRSMLVDTLAVNHVVTGRNFHFGAKRSGNSASLASDAKKYGFTYEAMAPVHVGGDIVSSTAIRTLLAQGAPEKIMPLLGRNYAICGHVQHGDKRGRTLGFPTANISLDSLFIPKLGVYAVNVFTGGEYYKGVANIGINPMFGASAPRLEAHLFNFASDIYGRRIKVELVSYLRGEQVFASVEALKEQMARDTNQAKGL